MASESRLLQKESIHMTFYHVVYTLCCVLLHSKLWVEASFFLRILVIHEVDVCASLRNVFVLVIKTIFVIQIHLEFPI